MIVTSASWRNFSLDITPSGQMDMKLRYWLRIAASDNSDFFKSLSTSEKFEIFEDTKILNQPENFQPALPLFRYYLPPQL